MVLKMCLYSLCTCACARFLPMWMKVENQPCSLWVLWQAGLEVSKSPNCCPVHWSTNHSRTRGCSILAEPQCCLSVFLLTWHRGLFFSLASFSFMKNVLLGRDTIFNTANQDVSTFKLHCSNGVILTSVTNNALLNSSSANRGPGTDFRVGCNNKITFSFWEWWMV